MEKMKQMNLTDSNMPIIREESHCCGAVVYGETKICSACKEHCEVVSFDEEDKDNFKRQ